MTTEAQPQNVKYVPKRKIRSIGSHYSVYEATQVGLNRPVELRVFNTKLKSESPELARFKVEFSTLATVDHPNIIRVLDLGVMADHVFYVTDLRDAKSFSEFLEKGRQFTIEDSLAHTKAIASALAHLHKKGILHRDLSTSTIFLDLETNIPYIAEFSLLKNLNVQGLTQRGIPTLRTLGRTPEAIAGTEYDQRTDVYLLGAFLYRLLTEQDPPIRVAGKPDQEPVRPRAVNSNVPPEVDGLVARALKPSQEDRFATMDEFHAEIERAIEKLEVKAAISEIAESTMTGLRMMRPPRQQAAVDETVRLERPSAGAPAPGAAAQPAAQAAAAPQATAATTTVARDAMMSAKVRRKGVVEPLDPMLWIRAHKDYIYLGAAPALLVIVLAVLVIARPESSNVEVVTGGPDRPAQSAGPGGNPKVPEKVEARDYTLDVKKVAQAAKSMPTNKENFHQRWYLLDNWIKQLSNTQKQSPFNQSDLVSVRINFYRDEQEASTKLDGLYEKALASM